MKPTVTVCINTFQRPEMLGDTLESLDAQKPILGGFNVVVVDNDEAETGRATVERFRQRLEIRYLVEKQRNIAIARNRAVSAADGFFVALIDDDETAAPDWLHALLTRAEQARADAVFGPVLATFAKDAPGWCDGSLYSRLGPGRDALVDWHEARSGNALIRRELFAREGYRFDPEYGRCGGSDVQLFRRMHEDGKQFAWADAGRVEEVQPRQRTTLQYLLRRRFRGGILYERITNRRGALRAGAVFCYRVARGIGQCFGGALTFSSARCINGMLSVALACGGLVGWLRPGHHREVVAYGAG